MSHTATDKRQMDAGIKDIVVVYPNPDTNGAPIFALHQRISCALTEPRPRLKFRIGGAYFAG